MAMLSDLTRREVQVLQLVLAGRTNKSIAAKIHVSEKTVEFHLNNIYTKVGVRTRVLAGVWAIGQGVEVETDQFPSSFSENKQITCRTLPPAVLHQDITRKIGLANLPTKS